MLRSRVVLLAHESGDGGDALARLAALAQGLGGAGWQCAWAGRDLAAVHKAAGAHAPLWPAPHDWGQDRRWAAVPVPQASYASVLLGQGWGDADFLALMLQGWQQILRHVGPDLVVVDGAPGAQWAACLLGIPVLQLGNEVSVPELANPMPVLRWWTREHDALAQAHDAQVSDCLRAVLPRLHNPAGRTVRYVADALAAPLRCIGSPAVLLRNPARTDALVMGPVPVALDEGLVREAVAGVPCWEGPASHSQVCAALARGDFMLLRPANLEQWLRARWLAQLGMAEVIVPSATPALQQAQAQRALKRAAAKAPFRGFPGPSWDLPGLVARVQALCGA